MANVQPYLSSQSYPGQPLPSPTDIRLIHLQPGTDDVIKCELVTANIDSMPSYEALSYTWGDPSNRSIIHVTAQGSKDPQEFTVTTNCFLALQRLRYNDRPRVLWIDALAIDQSNIPERNHQVSLMSKIYSQAAAVVIYLGEGTDESDLVMEYIHDCHEPGPEIFSFPSEEILTESLLHFFSRPWFSRVWVIQEAFLSAEKTLVCGEKSLSWSAIKNFKYYLASRNERISTPYVVSQSKKTFWQETSGKAMMQALLDSRYCEATDPRDKVYSLLPLLESLDKPLRLSPKYEDSVEKVYTDCARILLEDVGWKVLYAVQSGRGSTNLPSWVPDWSLPPVRHILGEDWRIGMDWDTATVDFWTNRDNLGADEKPQVVMRKVIGHDESASVLRGHGYYRGKITRLGTTYLAGQLTFPFNDWWEMIQSLEDSNANGSPGERKRNAWKDNFSRFLDIARPYYTPEKESSDNPKMPPVSEQLDSDDESYWEEEHHFGPNWEHIVRQRALEKSNGQTSILPFREIPFHLAGRGLPPSDESVMYLTLEACHSRRCFVTDTGYFGLAPEEAEVGDHLYLCVGATVPFILRETKEKEEGKMFRLVGECYLENRAWHDLNHEDNNEKLQVVDIM